MSLDFYLQDNYCGHCGRGDEVFHRNITHNLGSMAKAAGIYLALWRPEEFKDPAAASAASDAWKEGRYDEGDKIMAQIPPVYARDIMPVLQEGLAKLEADPEHYEKYNSPNGWGLYKHFVPFVIEVLEACEKYPDAVVKASR